MKIKRRGFLRVVYGVTALSLAVAALVPALRGDANAALVTSRSVQISSSKPGDTGVSYLFTFTAPTAAQSMVIDFCGDTPIIGASCDTTTSTSTGLPGFTAAGGTFTNGSGMSGWSLTATQFNLKLNGAATSAGATLSFTIGGITNTTTAKSFYARIYTYANNTYGTYASAASPGNYQDYGGVALSTAAVINVTARVMESLSFCVYNATCGDDPSVTIGHGSPTKVIDASAVDTAAVNFSLSTNAQSGAIVRLKGDTLKSGSNSLLAAGATATTISNGDTVHQFGVRVSTAGSMTAQAPYNGGAGSYGLDTSSGTNITSLYGQPIASIAAPVNASISTLTFAATASNTTAAGIYTAAEQLIATGTF